MQTFQRIYQGESDQRRMAALARGFPAAHLHVADLPYRLSSWALDDSDRASLWFNAEQDLVAWAVLQSPFWTIDITCHPEAVKDLYPQILAWADERARAILETAGGRPAWFINVFANQTGRIRDLEAAGFVSPANAGQDAWSKVLMQRPAEMPVKHFSLPAGFTVRPLAGVNEVEAYVELHRSVFESKNMTVEWRKRTLRQTEYRHDLDLVVATPDGRLAAFCFGWLNQGMGSAPSGQIEPLGCHKDFRKYALGRSVLAEAMRRLQTCGAQSLYVETDNYRNTAFLLYVSLGFRVLQDVLVYRKDYADSPG